MPPSKPTLLKFAYKKLWFKEVPLSLNYDEELEKAENMEMVLQSQLEMKGAETDAVWSRELDCYKDNKEPTVATSSSKVVTSA